MFERKIIVEVKPNKSENKIEKISDSLYKVSLKASPVAGKANRLLINVMADYFKVAKSQVEIKVGKTSKTKVLVIYG